MVAVLVIRDRRANRLFAHVVAHNGLAHAMIIGVGEPALRCAQEELQGLGTRVGIDSGGRTADERVKKGRWQWSSENCFTSHIPRVLADWKSSWKDNCENGSSWGHIGDHGIV